MENREGSRKEREEDDYSGSSVSKALMGVWRVTSPLQAGQNEADSAHVPSIFTYISHVLEMPHSLRHFFFYHVSTETII